MQTDLYLSDTPGTVGFEEQVVNIFDVEPE